MAKVVRGVDSYKKEFLSIFNSLCGRHGRWEVWSDFIQLTAIDISNVTDKANAPKRAADARNIAKKYSEDEIKRMAEMLMQMVYAIDENPDQDFLGELYMACNLGNDHAGQFFTPYNVCQCMSEITYDVPALLDGKGFIAVNDPACGAGALLLSFANACKRHDINYQQKVLFVAQDIDYTVGLMCYIQLSLMGCAGYELHRHRNKRAAEHQVHHPDPQGRHTPAPGHRSDGQLDRQADYGCPYTDGGRPKRSHRGGRAPRRVCAGDL